MKNYKCLGTRQLYTNSDLTMVPIREKDKYLIMEWRNEQIYHLRQKTILTKNQQDQYFEKILGPSFDIDEPNQILFSILSGDKCIGYGGLVHIDWYSMNAEISFLMDTTLETNYFEILWNKYLEMIKSIAFNTLKMNKIYVYSFDLRPLLYRILFSNNFVEEACLKMHHFSNNKYVNVYIHSLFRK